MAEEEKNKEEEKVVIHLMDLLSEGVPVSTEKNYTIDVETDSIVFSF